LQGLGLSGEQVPKPDSAQDQERAGLESMAAAGDTVAMRKLEQRQEQMDMAVKAQNGELSSQDLGEYRFQRGKELAVNTAKGVSRFFKRFLAPDKVISEAGAWVGKRIDNFNDRLLEKQMAKSEAKDNLKAEKEFTKMLEYADKKGLEDVSELPPLKMKESILGLNPGERAMAGQISLGYKIFGSLGRFRARKQEVDRKYKAEVENEREVARLMTEELEAPHKRMQEAEAAMQSTEQYNRAEREKEYEALFADSDKFYEAWDIQKKIEMGKSEAGLNFDSAHEMMKFYEQAQKLGIEVPKIRISVDAKKSGAEPLRMAA